MERVGKTRFGGWAEKGMKDVKNSDFFLNSMHELGAVEKKIIAELHERNLHWARLVQGSSTSTKVSEMRDMACR